MSKTVTVEHLKHYEVYGFVILEEFFEEAELLPVIGEIENQVEKFSASLKLRGRISNTYEDYDFYRRMAAIANECDEAPGLFQGGTTMGPALAALWSSAKLLDVVANILGPNIDGGAIWNVRPKVPENALMTVPWHQDSGYLSPEGQYTPQPAAWIPLLDVDADLGCLQVIRGGHLPVGNAPHKVEKKFGDPRSWYLYIDENDLPSGEIVTCAMRRGSVLLIDENMPHRGLVNRTDRVRWALDIRWQKPSDPTGLEGVLMRGPSMRRSAEPGFYPDVEGWAKLEREKYDAWVKRDGFDSLEGGIDGAWYFARWDSDFRETELIRE